jgi:hypothetical protein
MLEYTIVSESRNIRLVFKADFDLAKTHTVLVTATHINSNTSWTFTHKSVLLVTELDVIELAKKVVSNRAKSFWTNASKPLQKELKELNDYILNTVEYFEYQSERFFSEMTSIDYVKKHVSPRMWTIWQRSNKVVSLTHALIDCL